MTVSRAAKRMGIGIGVVAVIGLLVLAWFGTRPGPMAFAAGKTVALNAYSGHPTGVPPDFHDADPLARGRYLTQAADCQACHTAEGGKAFAGGRPFKTPFGTLYSPNITPDAQTGIGRWSDADFLNALHRGVGRDGKRLYPAFPYAAYTYLTDEDGLAIKAYLFSLAPVENVPAENDLSFPFNQRWLMSFWSLLFNPNERFQPVADRSDEWNRGAYVVEGLAHCGECHTPRNLLQALDNTRKFSGALTAGWRAYNITNDRASGVGAWSDAEVAQYLSAGHVQGRGTATGPMGEAVDLSLRYLSAGDIKAMAVYLRSVPAASGGGSPSAIAGPAPPDHKLGTAGGVDPLGKHIFEGACVSCHAWTGSGALTPYATLTGARAVNDPSAVNVVQVILSGAQRESAAGRVFMPAFGQAYSDLEVAAVSSYVTSRFGANGSDLSARQVAELRRSQ